MMKRKLREGGYMVNEKLQSIGQKLNISGQDIKNIQKAAIKEKIVRFFFHPILRVVLSILTFIVGISLGRARALEVYPFAAAVGLAITPEEKKSILMPIITFIAGYLVGRTFFSVAIMYNVYSRN